MKRLSLGVFSRAVLLVGVMVAAFGAVAAPAEAANLGVSPAVAVWVDQLLSQMTDDEKLTLVHGGMPAFMKNRPSDVAISAGYVEGVARLGIPPLRESDASLGVANAGRRNDDAVALPSGLLLASTFDPEIAFAGGAMIGKEARQKGFNVMLDGGVNLVREPRNGRNFEYLGEDPLLAGLLGGAAIRGIQTNAVASTVKHYALNAQEDGRHLLNSVINPAALRESDLLAFEIAIETGRPASVMCAYNKVNSVYACENKPLLADVLKHDWGWPGFVMSDWGAVHSATASMAGLDQESGEQLDREVYFGAPLKAAIAEGQIPHAQLDDMVRRILTGMAETGLLDPLPAPAPLDTAADAPVAQREAEAGIVLLKNDGGLLPLVRTARRIVVIGGKADIGVLSGGGSSQVIPLGSHIFPLPNWGPPWGAGIVYHPSSPLDALKAEFPGAAVSYDPGVDSAAAAAAARDADVVVVFATQWTSEGADVASLQLPDRQDEMIAAVAAANPRTVVVLETGGPVLMPWLTQVPAVVEAWYPGQKGGDAIARILAGESDTAGRLPVTFPQSLDQLPRPKLDGQGIRETLDPAAAGGPFDVNYNEGADVGYRWYERKGSKPLFPFGWGLSYSAFSHDRLLVAGGRTLTVSFRIANVGPRPGADVAQIYAAAPGQTRRLIGWGRVSLRPGESRIMTVVADPRLLARFDTTANRWRVPGGLYQVTLSRFAGDPDAKTASAEVTPAMLEP
jgi:beta-glucosidase